MFNILKDLLKLQKIAEMDKMGKAWQPDLENHCVSNNV